MHFVGPFNYEGGGTKGSVIHDGIKRSAIDKGIKQSLRTIEGPIFFQLNHFS